jgi:hypothetical protein
MSRLLNSAWSGHIQQSSSLHWHMYFFIIGGILRPRPLQHHKCSRALRICSLLTMEPAAYINYKLQIQGLFFLGLIVGVVLAEIFCSGRLSDWVVQRLTLKNGGQRLPEMRLWLGYPAAVSSSIGLIVWGLSIDREWHWMTGQVAFFLCE